MTEINNENEEDISFKNKDINIKEIQNQNEIDNSIINNNDNYNLNKNNNIINKEEKTEIDLNIILNNKLYNNNNSFKKDLLITSLPDINNNLNNNQKNINKKEEIKNQIEIISNNNYKNNTFKTKILNKNKSASNIITENNNLYKHFSLLNQIKINLNSEFKTEREKEEENLKILNNITKKEKERKIKIKDMIKNIFEKKPNFVNKNKISEKKYLYMLAEEKEKQRLLKEEFLISIENEKRKLKLSPISGDELNKFSQEVMNNQKLLKADLEIKKLQLNSLWKERKKLLPQFKSIFQTMNMKYDEEKKNLSFNKKEQITKEVNNKKLFGKMIYSNFQPKIINDKLKTEREQKIKELNGIGRYDDIKNLDKKLKSLSQKIYNLQPKNFKINNKVILEENKNKKIALIKKPKDYLPEVKIINSTRQYSSRKNNFYLKRNNDINIKMKAEIFYEKAKEKRMLLKYEKNSGNINKIDKLNSELSDLYFNSIQAKLKILNDNEE